MISCDKKGCVYMKDKIEKIVLDTYDGEISEEEKKRQIEKMMQIYNSIVAAVDGKLSEEKILELLEQLGAGTQGVPIIKIFSDPNEFEASTRRKSDVYAHSWAGKTAEKTETWVLLGDYEPGIDDVYNYSDNGNMLPTEETHEMSDFSIDQIQAAITVETNFSNYNGDERDEYEEIIQLYLPGELDVSKGNKFKQIVLQQRAQQLFDSIKATVGVRLTDEQIHSIVRQYDFENMDIPEIVVSTDFHILQSPTNKTRTTNKKIRLNIVGLEEKRLIRYRMYCLAIIFRDLMVSMNIVIMEICKNLRRFTRRQTFLLIKYK